MSQVRFNKFIGAIDDQISGKINLIHTSMPAQIVSYTKGRATVKPMLPFKLPDGRVYEMSLITDVPVCFPAASGVAITFPLQPGDEGWLNFSESSLDDYLLDTITPDLRKHALTDAVFFPVCVKTANIVNPDDLSLSFGKASIRLTKAGKIIIGGDVEVSGKTVTAELTAGNVAYTTHVHKVIKEGQDTLGPKAPI